jgi:hypothetical protein
MSKPTKSTAPRARQVRAAASHTSPVAQDATQDVTHAAAHDARLLLDELTAEAGLRQAVQQELSARGWRWSYIPDSRQVQGHPGIPDIVAVRDHRLLFIELKKENGVLSGVQHKWCIALALTCAEMHVWRPSDRARISAILA